MSGAPHPPNMSMSTLACGEHTEPRGTLMIRTARWTPAIAGAALLFAVAACGGGGATTGSSAGASPAAAAGTPAAAASSPAVPSTSVPGDTGNPGASGAVGAATGNDRCALFTTDQVTPLTGGPFQTSDPSMLDVPGCQWYFDSGVGNIQLQILPGAQYTDWSTKPGVTALSGVGDSGFVGPYVLGGTMAGALVGTNFYFLTVAPAPSNDAIAAFLKLAIAQAGGS